MSFFNKPSEILKRLNSASRGRIAIAACLLWSGLWLTPDAHAGQRWTSLTNNRTVDAEFVGLWGEDLVLELADGRRITVKLELLVAESRIQARRLADQQRERRKEMKDQILADAKEAAAPAPTPLPKPPAPPAYRQPPVGAGVLETLEWWNQQDQNGHFLLAAFDAMPASYQGDIERVARSIASKVDPNGLKATVGPIHSIGDLIVTRQRWLFSHPRLSKMDDTSKEFLKDIVLAVGGFVRDGLDPNQLDLEGLKTMPFKSWLNELDQRVAPHYASLTDQLESIEAMSKTFEVVEEKAETAVVESTMGGVPMRNRFVLVDGKWLPAEIAPEVWSDLIQKAEAGLGSQAEGSVLAGGQSMMLGLLIERFIGPAKNARSADDFHAAMDTWFVAASPLIAQMQSSMGAGLANNARGSGYGSGYAGSSDYEDEMMEYGMEDDEYEMEMSRGQLGGAGGPAASGAPLGRGALGSGAPPLGRGALGSGAPPLGRGSLGSGSPPLGRGALGSGAPGGRGSTGAGGSGGARDADDGARPGTGAYGPGSPNGILPGGRGLRGGDGG